MNAVKETVRRVRERLFPGVRFIDARDIEAIRDQGVLIE